MLSSTLLPLLLLLPSVLGSQITFKAHDELRKDSDDRRFPSHRLFPLSDGSFIPSPAFGAGSVWKGENVTEIVLSALKVGYRHLDNAAAYRNQEYVAEAIKLSGLQREDLYITSKYDRLEGNDPEQELHDTLRKLNTTYLDLYLIHFPGAAPNPTATWATFESFVHRGLVRSIGVSNYRPRDLSTLLASPSLTIQPVVNQIPLHLYNQLEMADTLRKCQDEGIQVAGFATLTSLTTRPGGKVDRTVEKIAKEKGITEGQVTMKWADQKDWVVVTTSGKDYRQKEQLEVFGKDFASLSEKEVAKLEKKGRKQEKKDRKEKRVGVNLGVM